jgi:catechol 2,3-dioxygenase-like lactoylglutathione lyase family enzyme
MQLSHLCEVILYVEDMSAQVRFYRDVLGLRLTHPPGIEDFSDQYWVTFDTGSCTLALHGGGHRRIGEDSPKIVFLTEDLAASRSILVSRGVAISAPRSPAPGHAVCDAKDPEGNPFSIEARAAVGG